MINTPTTKLLQYGEPYCSYIKEIKNTLNYKYYSPMISSTKLTYWDLQNNQAGLSIVRIMYASLLELFIRDNTEEMFYYIFEDYVKEVFKGTDNVLYIDGDNDSGPDYRQDSLIYLIDILKKPDLQHLPLDRKRSV